MSVVPIQKMSRKRTRTRNATKHGKVTTLKQLAICSNCNAKVMPHSVCSNCGYYKGKKVLAKLV